jgi:hypothetical protein
VINGEAVLLGVDGKGRTHPTNPQKSKIRSRNRNQPSFATQSGVDRKSPWSGQIDANHPKRTSVVVLLHN